MKHRLSLDGQAHDVWLARQAGGHVLRHDDASHQLAPAPRATVAVDGDEVHIHLDGRVYQVRYEHPLDRFAHVGEGKIEDVIRAPMPGVVIALEVAPHDVVTSGDTLMVIESMKMETAVKAARDGVVEAVHFGLGQSFDRDTILVTLTARED